MCNGAAKGIATGVPSNTNNVPCSEDRPAWCIGKLGKETNKNRRKGCLTEIGMTACRDTWASALCRSEESKIHVPSGLAIVDDSTLLPARIMGRVSERNICRRFYKQSVRVGGPLRISRGLARSRVPQEHTIIATIEQRCVLSRYHALPRSFSHLLFPPFIFPTSAQTLLRTNARNERETTCGVVGQMRRAVTRNCRSRQFVPLSTSLDNQLLRTDVPRSHSTSQRPVSEIDKHQCLSGPAAGDVKAGVRLDFRADLSVVHIPA